MELTAVNVNQHVWSGLSILAASAVLYVCWMTARNLFFSPVRSAPGPLLAKLSSKYILFTDLAGRRGKTIHALHKKYGPVVQLAPNELSFSAIESIKAIYGVGTPCIKSNAYDNFGRPGLFQMQRPEEHRQRYKMIAHTFAQSSIQQMEPAMHSIVAQLIDAIAKRIGTPVDVLYWVRMTALEVSGEILLGQSFNALNGDGHAPAYVHHLDNAYLVWTLYGLAPWLCSVLRLLPFKGLQEFLSAGDYVYSYGDTVFQKHLSLYGRSSKRRSLLTKMIAGNPSAGIEPLPDAEISVEVSDLVFAATDTTGNTMTYALYRLCCHPEWQERLRYEILDLDLKSHDFNNQSLLNLPILNGIIYETLRLHPAAPTSLPRITPAEGCEIGGIFTPGKTLVSMQALTTQRDSNYFPKPDEFDPNRWISTNGGTSEMKEMMLVWGKGTRMCLGQYMALMEIRILLARLIDRFTVRLEGAQTHDDMEMTDHFTLIPKGKRCNLIFEEAKHD